MPPTLLRHFPKEWCGRNPSTSEAILCRDSTHLDDDQYTSTSWVVIANNENRIHCIQLVNPQRSEYKLLSHWVSEDVLNLSLGYYFQYNSRHGSFSSCLVDPGTDLFVSPQ